MDSYKVAPHDPSAPMDGVIDLLLEQGVLSLPMAGITKGLIAAECTSDVLLRTLSGSSTSPSGIGRAILNGDSMTMGRGATSLKVTSVLWQISIVCYLVCR